MSEKDYYKNFYVEKTDRFDLISIGYKTNDGYCGTWIVSKEELGVLHAAIHEFLGEEPKKLAPLHPGEVLLEEFMKPSGMSVDEFISRSKTEGSWLTEKLVYEILLGNPSYKIDYTVADKISRVFDTTPEFWLNLQAEYDKMIEEDAK